MILNCITAKDMNVKKALVLNFNLSSRLIRKLNRNHKIFCNGKVVNISETILKGSNLSVDTSFDEESENILPTKMDLDILYEDECLLILNKPPFIPTHPSINHYQDSISNGVRYYFNKVGLKTKIRPVIRLDKNTSGIVIFAKNEYIQECLITQMKKGIFEKEYLAIVKGNLTKPYIEVEANIAREKESIITRCVEDNGQYAKTIFEVLKEYDKYSLVRCSLLTGRTHQIRVHAKYIGHPVLGDNLYGTSSIFISRQALHAYKVKFTHPITKRSVEITCDLPLDMEKMV